MGYGDPTLTSTKRPKRTAGGKKKIVRRAHRRGSGSVTAHSRRLSNGKVVLVKATRRRSTTVKQHEKSGKGYGIRERRPSGKLDYRRKQKQSKDRGQTKRTTRKTNIKSR